jgi:hypothetical protein
MLFNQATEKVESGGCCMSKVKIKPHYCHPLGVLNSGHRPSAERVALIFAP